MKKVLLTVATVTLLYAAVVVAAPNSSRPHASLAADQAQTSRQTPHIQTYLGTITKAGVKFVFSDDVTKTSYQLDDQRTAEKFDGEKVKVTGVLDASGTIIRVQSIAATS